MNGRVTALVVVAAALAACSSSSSAPPATSSPTLAPSTSVGPRTVAVVGTMSIADTDGWGSGGDLNIGAQCRGWHGYDDVNPGAEVVISDDTGHTLAITSLRGGRISDAFDCAFRFRARVPAGKGFYGIQVTHRGVVKEPETELGDVALTIGG